MTALAAWGALKRVWYLVPIAALLVALLLARADARHNLKGWQGEKAAHALDLANIRAASAKAIADNIADVRAKESDGATLVETKQHDLESQLAAARAAAARYGSMRRCEAGADPRSASAPRDAETAGAASDPVGTGGDALVPQRDLEVCAAAVVKAKGWQAFYSDLRTRYNADGTP